MYGGGWWVYAWGSDQDKNNSVTWPLVKRVLGYARPYWTKIAITLVTILITTGLGLPTPLIFRDLIDNALPKGDVQRRKPSSIQCNADSAPTESPALTMCLPHRGRMT